MNGAHLLTELATITDRTQTDDRDSDGNPIITETTREDVPCWHEQVSSGEIPPIAEQTHDLYLPAGDPTTATAKVTIGPDSFEVIGPPAQLVNPRSGELALVKAAIRKTTG